MVKTAEDLTDSRSSQKVVGSRAAPSVAVFNAASIPLGVDFDDLVSALQVYVTEHIEPVWGTPAKLVKSDGFMPGHWALVLLDDADKVGVAGYHDLTPDGRPQAKVFVRTTLAGNELVSVAASHELVEMLVDPSLSLLSKGPEPDAYYAYESADPVEALTFPVAGIAMSDFVYPSYFETFQKSGSVRFDHMGKVRKPFGILPGGYQSVLRAGTWHQIFGSAGKARSFALEDRRGHRSEQRKAPALRAASRALFASHEVVSAVPDAYRSNGC